METEWTLDKKEKERARNTLRRLHGIRIKMHAGPWTKEKMALDLHMQHIEFLLCFLVEDRQDDYHAYLERIGGLPRLPEELWHLIPQA